MDESPDRLRQEIARAHDRLSATIASIAYKANIPARVRESVQTRVTAMRSQALDASARVQRGVRIVLSDPTARTGIMACLALFIAIISLTRRRRSGKPDSITAVDPDG